MDRDKQIILLQRAVQSDTSPNILIYGDKEVGKKYILYGSSNPLRPH